MEKFVYYNSLLLIYGNILKDKHQEIFDLYYGENLTMQEIADLKKITKSRVGLIIKNVENELDNLENKMHLLAKKQELENILNENDIDKIKDKINTILKGE